MARQKPVFPRKRHDHGACVAEALARAESVCAADGGRLTPLRRRILELVWSSHKPVGAYAVLQRLTRERSGAAPPTVYRSLDFLLQRGLIHRIRSLNAFVGCAGGAGAHASQFLICRNCGTAAELTDEAISRALIARAAGLRFAAQRQTVEIEGLCRDCRDTHAA
jgi:Fur family zinc uptake transcriptional regulator